MPKKASGENPKPTKNWTRPSDEKSTIFIHSAIDEYGLNIYEFRVLAHVARRESKTRGCDAAQARIARVCGISQRMVLEVLGVLCEAGILSKTKARDGRRTNSYRLNPPSRWKEPQELEEIRKRRKRKSVEKSNEELNNELDEELNQDLNEKTNETTEDTALLASES